MATICRQRKCVSLVTAVERTREHAQELAAEQKSILRTTSDFTRIICGYPKQIGAITLTHCCGHCQCIPLSDCMWFMCGRVSQRMIKQRQPLVLREAWKHVHLERRTSMCVFEVWFLADRCVAILSIPNATSRAAGTSWRRRVPLHFLERLTTNVTGDSTREQPQNWNRAAITQGKVEKDHEQDQPLLVLCGVILVEEVSVRSCSQSSANTMHPEVTERESEHRQKQSQMSLPHDWRWGWTGGQKTVQLGRKERRKKGKGTRHPWITQGRPERQHATYRCANSKRRLKLTCSRQQHQRCTRKTDTSNPSLANRPHRLKNPCPQLGRNIPKTSRNESRLSTSKKTSDLDSSADLPGQRNNP